MTLKDKMLEVADSLENEAFKYPKIRTMGVVNIILRRLANEYNDDKKNDNYAVEFAEWLDEKCSSLIKDGIYKGKYCYLKELEYYTSQELLEIFKKEKGL